MLCPNCKNNTFEPEYYEKPNYALRDHPIYHNEPAPPLKVLRHFRCSTCQDLYYVCAGETAAEAYWRIMSEFAKD